MQKLNISRRTLVLSVIAVLLFAGFIGVQLTEGADSEYASWLSVSQWLLVGLAIFLFGLEEMERALKAVAGNRMRSALRTLTANRIKGLLAGLITTAAVQSSTVTTIMMVGFVSAGLMTFVQTVPAIIGANIGSTVTAQLISFNITAVIPLLIVLGYVLMRWQPTQQKKRVGRIFLGFGLLFWGLDLMSGAMEPLRDSPEFISLMANMDTAIIGIAAAALFTAVVQSSAATMGVVIALALQGLISLEAGIALTLGANIGTTASAALAAIGKTRNAVRVAVAHSLFQVFGVALFIAFIPNLANLVTALTPAGESAAVLARQIANAHTIFNVSVGLLVLPFTGAFAALVLKLVPERPHVEQDDGSLKPKHLLSDENILHSPAAAIAGARLEMIRMGRRIERMLTEVLDPLFSANKDRLLDIGEQDNDVDMLYHIILKYLAKIRSAELSSHEAAEVAELTASSRYFEQIGDLIETNIVPSGIKLAERDIYISDKTQDMLARLHTLALSSLREVLDVHVRFADASSRRKAVAATHDGIMRIINRKREVTDTMDALYERTGERLTKAYATEADIIEAVKSIFFISRNIAKIMHEEYHNGTIADD